MYVLFKNIKHNMMNEIHGRALRLLINDHISGFDTLLQNNHHKCNRLRNIQTLMVEIYKIKKNLYPPAEEK